MQNIVFSSIDDPLASWAERARMVNDHALCMDCRSVTARPVKVFQAKTARFSTGL